ncbi:MAG TPA: ABC transporter ATP-binding protein [Trebonia sp.]|nr:ABC transporter ATP-binding protein [Trebonia sp.]
MLNADVEVDRRDFTVRARLSVPPGEKVALFGPSGAGKTTVLEAVAGLVRPRCGRIELNGRVLTSTAAPVTEVPPWRRRVGLLRQDPGLFPHLPVRANLLYARSASAGPELDALARELGIEELLAAMPARLSGGQRHRVALGRLLLAHCDALLLDEPFAGLDLSLRRSLTALVANLATERALPTLLVTHDLADAQAFADRLAVIERGAVLQEGTPSAVVLRPASRQVASLVGYLGFVPVPGDPGPGGSSEVGGAGVADGSDGAGVAGRSGRASDSGVVAGVHPDRVVAGEHPELGLVVTGTVTAARPSGASWEVDVMRGGGAAFTCRLPSHPETGTIALTLLSPPLFAPDGTALDAPVVDVPRAETPAPPGAPAFPATTTFARQRED